MLKPKLILICGKKRSGKNALSTLISNEFTDKGYSVVEDMLAGELKRRAEKDFSSFAYVLNNELDKLQVSVDAVFNSTLNNNLTPQLNAIQKITDTLKIDGSKWYEHKNPLTRALLECYGTDIIRNRISDTYWIDDIKEKISFEYFGKYDVVMITDVRFPNEIESFYGCDISEWFDIISVRVERPIYNLEDYNHESNTSLDDFNQFSYIVYNERGLDELKMSAEEIVKDILIDK